MSEKRAHFDLAVSIIISAAGLIASLAILFCGILLGTTFALE